MKIEGTHTLPVGIGRAYAALQDPALLAQCIPGCEKLEAIGPDEYAMRMKMMLAAVSGQFEGKVKIAELVPNTGFRLLVEGQGKIGFMKGTGAIKLVSAGEASTQVNFDGDVQVGGTIAAVGSRLIDTTSKLMIKKFFEKFASVLA